MSLTCPAATSAHRGGTRWPGPAPGVAALATL